MPCLQRDNFAKDQTIVGLLLLLEDINMFSGYMRYIQYACTFCTFFVFNFQDRKIKTPYYIVKSMLNTKQSQNVLKLFMTTIIYAPCLNTYILNCEAMDMWWK